MTQADTMAEAQFMRRALRLAERGRGRVEPNPLVGAVLVKSGRVIGEGYHRRFGGPHAEIEAINRSRAAGHHPAGSTLYVTLEPCCHVGKTPPCTEALIEARVAQVVAAMVDPNPQVAGRGIRRLRRAGVAVQVGLLGEHARALNEPFIKRVQSGMPWVIAKWAQSLDGRIATRHGDSRWISNEASRRWVHELRARVDAIMVGIGTVLADDPRLTARHVPVKRWARPVVVDPRGRIPHSARLFAGRPGAGQQATPVTLAVHQEVLAARPRKLAELEAMGVELIGLSPVGTGKGAALALGPLLRHLSEQHAATNVLVEGGSKLVGSLLDQGLVDQVLVFVAPILLGDSQAVPAVQGLISNKITSAHKLILSSQRRFGDDLLLDYRVGSHPS